MYGLRSRPGIHRKPISEQAAKLENSSSVSDKEDCNRDTESESEESNPCTAREYERIYPDLSKISFNDRDTTEEKYSKLKESEEACPKNPIFSGIRWNIVFIIAILIILIPIYFCITDSARNFTCETPMCLFQDQFKHLRATFVNQEKLSWKVIGTAVISVVNKTAHTQPAVILLIANKNAKMVSSCIANSLASSVEMSYGNSANHPKLQIDEYINPNQMKETIYKTFEESFGKQNHHAIVLEDIDTFTADTAMALHLFCDHENAPYKNIAIILTAVIEDYPENKKFQLKDMHSIAENHLNKIWKSELWEEKRAALLSRITGSVAIIRSEKNVPRTCY